MIATNELLNRINDWNAPEQNAFKRHIGSRFTNLCATAPIQTIAIAQNILIFPLQVVGLTLNLGAKAISIISCSDALKDFRANMPTLSDLVRTVARVVLYAIGTVFTATLGVLSPRANFKVQCGLGLAINLREETLKLALIEAEVERLNELALQAPAETLSDVILEEGEKLANIIEDGVLGLNEVIEAETEKAYVAIHDEMEKMAHEREVIKNEIANAAAESVIVSEAAHETVVAEVSEPLNVVTDADKNEVETLENNIVKNAEDADIDDDILIDFEGVEDTAIVKALQGAREKGSKAVDDTVNFFSKMFTTQDV